MTKQTFTTGQVLTAAQMTSLQQTAMGGGSTTAKVASYTLVAADAGTVVQMNAAGATTITVNQNLFSAGDTLQIQNIGAGVCTVTAGSASVNTAGSLALSQYEGGQLYFNTASAAFFFDIVQSSGMTNPLTTTGDIIYSSSGSTPARLGIGTTGQVLNVASGLPAWATASSNKVVQIVYANINTTVNNSTTTYADTLLTATITPTSASNKVLVFVEQNGLYKDANNTSGFLKLLRGSTDLLVFATNYAYTASIARNQVAGGGLTFLDSPATTSATTYKTQFKASVAAAYVGVQQDNEYSTITLMEVTP
jgi:hypothetical protein